MTDLAISVTNVSKSYRIWKDPSARLKGPLWKALGGLMPDSILRQSKSIRERVLGTQLYHHDFYALKDINLEVRRGESVGIVGRNGSGKSTLLQIIAGTLTPTSGQVRINGRVAALLELGSGFNPDFTGRENVYLNASILGLTKEEIDGRYDAITTFADIGDFINQPVKTYSSGMSMRLAFAVVAHVDADILIVDEALAVGDAFFMQKCMRFIREFQKRGTLLLVTHDSQALTALCQNALWIHQGRSVALASAKVVSQDYLKAEYAETQGVTFFTDNEVRRNEPPRQNEKIVDFRSELLNNSNLRNDLQVFDFNAESPAFGAGGATITYVRLLDAASGNPLAYGVGGEEVILRISASVHANLQNPIIGFYLKNSLGQHLFGDNTYLLHKDSGYPCYSGQILEADFLFQMPYLPAGTYVFSAACATGTQDDHVQHHWLHEALSFKSQSTHNVGGLVGIPMRNISLRTRPTL